MLISQRSGDGWQLLCDGKELIHHSKSAPFATMIKLEKQYTANRGTVKTETVETARIFLTEVQEEANGVCFSGEGHTLRLTYAACEGGAELHFAPCRVREEGFRCLVVLTKGTNAPLEAPVPEAKGEDRLLWMTNKWLLCHPESPQAEKGAFVGIRGENRTVRL